MKSKKLEKLESVRGFAAIYVVLFHVLPQKIYLFNINFGFLFRFGPEAVIVFFILSGFVIQYSYERSKDKSFKYYFKRRFARLYIPLLIIFLVAYLYRSYEAGLFVSPEWKTLLGNILMLQDVISQKPNVICPTYMGNGVLWSLSYEWWFYMFFFFSSKISNSEKRNKIVGIITIVAALSYLIYPFIVNRFVMYFAIWWTGVRFADIYLKKESFNFRNILPHAYVLFTMIGILTVNLILNFSYTKVYTYPLVAYPFVELRHVLFATMVMFGAIMWKKINWFGFNTFFGVFKHLAPMSYVIYISHTYLVIEANYLNFINNKIIENTLYIIVMIAFSYLVEVIIYKKTRKIFINNTKS